MQEQNVDIPDFHGSRVLLAEDNDLNREISADDSGDERLHRGLCGRWSGSVGSLLRRRTRLV